MGAPRRRSGSLATVLATVVLGGLAGPVTAQASISISDASITEGSSETSVTFVVTRKAGLLAPAILTSYTTMDETARAPGDYTLTAGFVSFPSSVLGETQTRTFTVPVIGDSVHEETETFQIVLSGTELADGNATATILDDDAPFPAPGGRTSAVRQVLVSRSQDGILPNAPATEPVVSRDGRAARYIAYTSRATDIVEGADGTRANIYLVRRGGGTRLITRGVDGVFANGDSSAPVFDGFGRGGLARGPTCLGFVSTASNLVAGDTNGRADGFVRSLRGGGKLRRFGSPGGGAVSRVAVSGNCASVAVIAGGALYAGPVAGKLRRVVRGGVTWAELSVAGEQVAYARKGVVAVRRVKRGGGARRAGTGTNPTSDGGPVGRIGRVAYERGGSTFIRSVGGKERRMETNSSLPSMSVGGARAFFAAGPFVYLYAVKNNFGSPAPQGFCPLDQGNVTAVSASGRANYVAFACSGGAVYLASVGS
jgi:hypothetical protein